MSEGTGRAGSVPERRAPTFNVQVPGDETGHRPQPRSIDRGGMIHLVADLVLMGGAIVVVTIVLWRVDDLATSESVRLGLLVAVVVTIALGFFGAYDRFQTRRWPAMVADVMKAVLIGAGLFSLTGFFVAIGGGARRWLLVVTAVWTLLLGLHHGLRPVLRSRSAARRVVIAGAAREVLSMRTALRSDRRHRYQVVGFVLDSLGPQTPRIVVDMALGSIDELPDVVSRYDADEVLFCLGGLDGSKFAPLARELNRDGVDVALTGLGDVALRRVAVSHVQGRPVVSIAPAVRSGWRLIVKRGVDLVVASVLLLALAPLLALIALGIRIVDRQPPIFRQDRVGKGGELFEILKFRTMRVDGEPTIDLRNDFEGPLFKMEGDPRVTRLGRLLRTTSLDELPQLVNVVKGEMSLVGPRPFIPSEIDAAPARFRDRELVTPGMTGRWQVSGRSDTDFDQLDELDRWYVDNWSLAEDLEILARTVPAVLTHRGAK